MKEGNGDADEKKRERRREERWEYKKEGTRVEKGEDTGMPVREEEDERRERRWKCW